MFKQKDRLSERCTMLSKNVKFLLKFISNHEDCCFFCVFTTYIVLLSHIDFSLFRQFCTKKFIDFKHLLGVNFFGKNGGGQTIILFTSLCMALLFPAKSVT